MTANAGRETEHAAILKPGLNLGQGLTIGLPPGVFGTFTHTCNVCGSKIDVVDTVEQPHTCRVVIS